MTVKILLGNSCVLWHEARVTVLPTPAAPTPDLAARFALIIEGLIEDIARASGRRWGLVPLVLWVIRPYLRGIVKQFEAVVARSLKAGAAGGASTQPASLPAADASPPSTPPMSRRKTSAPTAAVRAALRDNGPPDRPGPSMIPEATVTKPAATIRPARVPPRTGTRSPVWHDVGHYGDPGDTAEMARHDARPMHAYNVSISKYMA